MPTTTNILEKSREVLRALLGVSAYGGPREAPYRISPESEAAIRDAMGGNLQPWPQTVTRWYLADLETAIHQMDNGNLAKGAQLYRSLRRDGVVAGLLSSCTDGLVRLPKRFYGSPEQVSQLEPRNGTVSLFDDMFPPAELALLAADGRVMGVGYGELVPVQGREFPVFRRLDPEFLQYRWAEGRWYFRSLAGPIPITPGDGRWLLHVPGGGVAPWQNGLLSALGRAWVIKDHALQHRSNYSAKLANPARVATAPLGATEPQRMGFLQRLIAWGTNSVFELPVGWDVKLVESNGNGTECFKEEIESSNNEFMIAIAGQVVTVTGGAGFANSDIHRSIRSDIIKSIGDGLAYTINTQGIPPWVVSKWGIDKLDQRAVVEWDVEPAKDRNAEAQTLVTVANAIGVLRTQLRKYDRDVDIVEICNRFGVPVLGDIDGDGTPDTEGSTAIASAISKIASSEDVDLEKLEQAIALAKSSGYKPTAESIVNVMRSLGIDVEALPPGQSVVAKLDLAPTDLAKCVRADEARSSQGLGPMGDERGSMLIAELGMPLAPTGATGSTGGDTVPAAPVEASEVSNEPITDEDSKRLAEEMTEHKIERCQHGSLNRCRLCKVERVRELSKDENGQPLKDGEGNQLWGVAWRHIQ